MDRFSADDGGASNMCVFLAWIQFSKAFRLVRGIRFDWKLSHFRLALVCCQDNFEKFNFPPASKRFGWVYVSVFAINVATSCWRAGENCLSAAILGQGANVKTKISTKVNQE